MQLLLINISAQCINGGCIAVGLVPSTEPAHLQAWCYMPALQQIVLLHQSRCIAVGVSLLGSYILDVLATYRLLESAGQDLECAVRLLLCDLL